MIKLVEAEFKGKSDGISFESFKTFYNVLFGRRPRARHVLPGLGEPGGDQGRVRQGGQLGGRHQGGPARDRGGLLPAGRGRRPQPEHEGVQPGPLLLAPLKRIPERGPKRDPWKYEVLVLVALLHLYYLMRLLHTNTIRLSLQTGTQEKTEVFIGSNQLQVIYCQISLQFIGHEESTQLVTKGPNSKMLRTKM